MPATFYYWTGFIAYAISVISVGIYIWLQEKKSGSEFDNNEFWSASRNLSGWSVGLSISASMMSISWSCVYGIQLFYWYGIGGAWLLIIPWLVTMGGFYIFTPLFRKFRVFSQPQLLENRFGTRSRQLLAPALIMVFITWTGAEIYAAGKIIAPFLEISLNKSLLLIALIVSIYSFSGGFSAVISTDKIQFALVALFITVVAFIGYGAVPGDVSLLTSVQPPRANLEHPLFTPGLALILITFASYLPGWLIETDVWLRLQAARSDRSARSGVLLAAFNSFVFVGIMPMIVGLSALVLFPAVNGAVPGFLSDGELILTEIMARYAPMWLNIFLSVGLIAAAMSTIDTCGNVVALSLSYDLVEPQLSRKWPPKKLNRLARLLSVAAIFISYIYALFTESLWDIFYLSSGILTTTVFIPVLSSFFPSTRKSQVYAAISIGFVCTLLFYFMESAGWLKQMEPAFISETGLGYILWGFLFSALGFFLARLLPEKSSDGQHEIVKTNK